MQGAGTPLLTIAVPTFNRAAQLSRQLEWLRTSLGDVGTACQVEVILSDNRSTDGTADIIERWCRAAPPGVCVRVNRHDANVGAVRNIMWCIAQARGRFVWAVSDDDQMSPTAVEDVLRRLRCDQDLALLLLNFSSRLATSGKLLFERCFDVDDELVTADGRGMFERFLAHRNSARWGGLALTSAIVYRSDLARAAIDAWPVGLDNLTFQLYVTAYCMQRGSARCTRENVLECVAGTHYFLEDDRVLLGFRYADVAETWVKLAEIGYSVELCLRKVEEQASDFDRRFLVRSLARWPLLTTRVLWRYLRARLLLVRMARHDDAAPHRHLPTRWRPAGVRGRLSGRRAGNRTAA